MTDQILSGMADELHRRLVAVGADTKNPPTGSNPPAAAAFAEYQKRGGTQFQDADKFATALVEEVRGR